MLLMTKRNNVINLTPKLAEFSYFLMSPEGEQVVLVCENLEPSEDDIMKSLMEFKRFDTARLVKSVAFYKRGFIKQ